MSSIGQPERATQGRVVAFFQDALGYVYLGNRKNHVDNSNLEEGLSYRLAEASGAQRQDHLKVLSESNKAVPPGGHIAERNA